MGDGLGGGLVTPAGPPPGQQREPDDADQHDCRQPRHQAESSRPSDENIRARQPAVALSGHMDLIERGSAGRGRRSGPGRHRARLEPSGRTRCPSCHPLPRGRVRRSGVSLQGRPKRRCRVAKSRLDRPDGHVKGLGDLTERPAKVVMQDEGGTLLRRQPSETAVESVARRDRLGVVRCRRTIDRRGPRCWPTIGRLALPPCSTR